MKTFKIDKLKRQYNIYMYTKGRYLFLANISASFKCSGNSKWQWLAYRPVDVMSFTIRHKMQPS